MATPIYYIKNGSLFFSDKTIFDNLNIYIYTGDRVCLIGRNGSGKSTLMKVINSEYQLNNGEIFQHYSTKIAYLSQEHKIRKQIKIYDFITQPIPHADDYYIADTFIEKLEIDVHKNLDQLSGGELRRVQLARALATKAEILLLDEPTNHLDIHGIEWLESYLKSYKGSIICISHDREFLAAITNKIWWLDRGALHKYKHGFSHFEAWQDEMLQHESTNLAKLSKKVNAEQSWLHQGLTARRKRNQRRLSELARLRQQLRSNSHKFADSLRKCNHHNVDANDISKTKFVIGVEDLSFKYQDKYIVKNFTINIMKGSKIGIIGPNGTGKSTLLRLFIKELNPNSGKVFHGANFEVTYFDQKRTALNSNLTIQQVLCPSGGDQVFLSNKTLHVGSYLKNFMFDPKILNTKVGSLSGGEASRLLLAKSLINPGNLLVMDEPTNDLDIDTIDLLLEILHDYPGTLIIVSHDRSFLDKLVTNTLVFGENGNIINVIGGYTDYLNYYHPDRQIDISNNKTKSNKKAHEQTNQIVKANKLSYKYQRMLSDIPVQITKLEQRIMELEKMLADSELYANDPESFVALSKEFTSAKHEIDTLLDSWQEIEILQNTCNVDSKKNNV